MLFSSVTLPPSANASGCDDLKFIFARGSGEQLNGDSATAWRQEITNQFHSSGLSYSFYELGSAAQSGHQYPAVAVSGSSEGILTMLGALFSGGAAYDFGDSVDAGVNELKAYISSVHASCPTTKFVLGGYSQGAMVISRTLPDLDPDQIIYAATFGDPKLYLPEGAGLPAAACLGRGYSSYRVYVPDCQAYFGVLGGYQPYQPAGYTGKLGTWCNQDDIMCSSGWSLSDHTAYVSESLYYDAAVKIRAAAAATFPDAWQIASTATSPHDLVILLDVTGSMRPVLETYRAEARRLASEVYQAGGRVALYGYLDLYYDGPPRLFCDFSCTQAELETTLDSIVFSGGGDAPESALSAALTAMNTLKWRPGATKTIVLLTDETYLSPDRDGVTLSEVVQRSLEIDPVNIYVITENAETAAAYSELARLTNGQVYTLDQRAEATDDILSRPTVFLEAPAYSGRIGDEFAFNVVDPSADLHYEWDLDGDGVFELNGPTTLRHQYSAEFDSFIQVRATAASGEFSTMSAHVKVVDSVAPSASISGLRASFTSAGTIQAEFTAQHTDRILVALDDAILGYLDASTTRFILTDIRAGSTLTLTPYNSAGQRGTAASIALPADPYAPTTTPAVTPENPHTPTTTPAVTPENPHTPTTTPAVTPENPYASTTAPTVIPKAPDAGVAQSFSPCAFRK